MSRRMVRHSRRPASRIVRGESRTHKLLAQNRVRLMSIIVCFAFSFTVLSMRLFEVSLMGGGDLPFKRLVSEPSLMLKFQDSAKSDPTISHVSGPVRRRDIVDRNGMVLATNVQTASLVANPNLILEPEKVAQQLGTALGDTNIAALQQKLARPHSTFIYLKRHLSPAEQDRVNALGVPGLFFEAEDRRAYPMGDLVSHVVGYVDVDNHGIAGIERSMEKRLDQALPDEKPLQLTIDVRLQSVMHQELAAAMQTYKAIGATGIIMDIHSGEVLSMVSLPTFDPNSPSKGTPDERFNRATLGTYEMGSSFKTFTFALALDTGIVSLNDSYDASHPIRAAGYTISDAHPFYRWLSVPEIFAYSSNIGTVQMTMDVGPERQHDFLKKLGMFEPVSFELPEVSKPLVPREWSRLASMTISFGHGISVSPLHLVRGIASMAGDGRLVQPTLLMNDAATQHKHAKKSPQIISEQTTKKIRQLMRSVVQYGTAKKANVKGYQVGGKTGTAEKIVNGRYEPNARISSFVGVFPTDHPRYVVFAMLDEPKGTKETYGFATGGWVAAPVIANVVSRMGPLLGMQPDMGPENPESEQFWINATSRATEAHLRPQPARVVQDAAYTPH